MAQLAAYERQLALFVEAMAGHYLHIKATSEWHLEGTAFGLAQQSSDALYFPDELPGESSSSYRVLALIQIGLREFGTFDFRLADLLRHDDSLGDKDEPALSPRSGDFEQWFSRYQQPGLLRTTFAVLERYRIEQRLCALYPGMRRHFHRWHYHHHQTIDSSGTRNSWAPPLDQASHQQGAGQPLTDNTLASILEPLWTVLSTPAAHVYTTSLAANRLYYALQSLQVESDDSSASGEALDWLQRKIRLKDWEEQLAGLDGELQLADLDNPASVDAIASDQLSGAPRPEELNIRQLQAERDQLTRRVSNEAAALKGALGTTNPDARSTRYPEWDHRAQRYLPNWCRLYETTLIADETFSPAGLRQRVLPYLHAVLSQLRQIKPRGLVRIRPEADGDELDITALIESRMDRRAGVTPDERLYSRQARLQRDLAVAFLVDLSASTDDPITPPPSPDPALQLKSDYFDLRDPLDFYPDESTADTEAPRRIIDVQREAMLVMAIALDQLGDEFGIYGFSGYGKDCVEYFVAKELGDVLTPRTLQIIAGMQPKRSTRMGPAIRHSIGKLTGSGRETRLLIILSDGFPQDSDYGPERGNHEYGVQDTAKALKEAEAQGITTFCVTVDRSGHDYLRDMCPDQRYMVIEDLEELSSELGKLYRTLSA